MKSVVRIPQQGKVKDVGQGARATGPVAQEVDSTVSLIQALIPLGLKAVGEAPMDRVMIVHPRATAAAVYSAGCRNTCRHTAIEGATRWR